MAAYDNWRFEVSSADPDAAEVWVNLTQWARTTGSGVRPVPVRRGRGSERDDIQPSTLTVTLDNTDHRFTPGNPSSPYVSWWGQGRKCRLVETILGTDYVRFTGYLKPLDLPDWAEPGVEQFVTVSAVDWLGRLDQAPAFTGTLQEHLRTQGGQLVEHFPLSDPYPQMSALTLATLSRVVVGFDSATAVVEPTDLLKPAALAGPPGDDLSYAQWQPLTDGTVPLARAQLETTVSVPVGAADVIAMSVWVQAQNDQNGYVPNGSIVSLLSTAPYGIIIGDYGFNNSLTGTWRTPGGDTDVAAGRRIERDAWRLVTCRFNAATGLLELWSGSDVAVSVTAALPGAVTLTRLSVGNLWIGGIGQLQVRVGASASTMTRAMHLAQYAHGFRGLQRQTVAERIATLAGYAGVPSSALDLDAGASTPMQQARLARQRPASAMRAAADAEGGARLFVTGAGKIRLRPRQARYNQAVTLQIPYVWLERGLRFREDSPINDVTASQANGGSTRRSDATSIARYGVGGDSVILDTAIDADPGNYASWTVAAYKTPGLRCPQLVIDLLPLTDAQRAQLLGLEIGDRVEITGGPATIPTAARHLIVEGFAPDEVGVQARSITLNTSPLLGPSAGSPPASVMVGDLAAATAIVAY